MTDKQTRGHDFRPTQCHGTSTVFTAKHAPCPCAWGAGSGDSGGGDLGPAAAVAPVDSGAGKPRRVEDLRQRTTRKKINKYGSVKLYVILFVKDCHQKTWIRQEPGTLTTLGGVYFGRARTFYSLPKRN